MMRWRARSSSFISVSFLEGAACSRVNRSGLQDFPRKNRSVAAAGSMVRGSPRADVDLRKARATWECSRESTGTSSQEKTGHAVHRPHLRKREGLGLDV